MKNPKQVVIMGGGFNPPTTAHLSIIELVLKNVPLDELWIMPSGARRDKSFAVTDEERLELLKIVTEHIVLDPRVKVVDYELGAKEPTETINTYKMLKEKFPDTNFRFAFGADSYWSMPEWNEGTWLQQQLDMVVFSRRGVPKIEAENVIYVAGKTDEGVSSTLIRNSIAENRPITGLTHPMIEHYIKRHQLYLE